MLATLKTIREEHEDAFTLIELLVVILIIGILAAIAIPVFLNQRKRANDAAVLSDVSNAAIAIESWATTNRDRAAEKLPADLAGFDVHLSTGVALAVTGSIKDGYCISGVHENGYQYVTETPALWNSKEGGLDATGVCKDAAAPVAGGDGGGESVALPAGQEVELVHRSTGEVLEATMTAQMDKDGNVAISVASAPETTGAFGGVVRKYDCSDGSARETYASAGPKQFVAGTASVSAPSWSIPSDCDVTGATITKDGGSIWQVNEDAVLNVAAAAPVQRWTGNFEKSFAVQAQTLNSNGTPVLYPATYDVSIVDGKFTHNLTVQGLPSIFDKSSNNDDFATNTEISTMTIVYCADGSDVFVGSTEFKHNSYTKDLGGCIPTRFVVQSGSIGNGGYQASFHSYEGDTTMRYDIPSN